MLELNELKRERYNELSDFKFTKKEQLEKLSNKDLIQYCLEMQESFIICLNDYELDQENYGELEQEIEKDNALIKELEDKEIDEKLLYDIRDVINFLLYEVSSQTLSKTKTELKFITQKLDFLVGNDTVDPYYSLKF